jgi:Mg-chelatase subunit ChlD
MLVMEDDKPEADLSSETSDKQFFIFIVDRSGSMCGGTKMAQSIQALHLFL